MPPLDGLGSRRKDGGMRLPLRLLVSSIAWVSASLAQEPATAPTASPGADTITIADLREHIGYLAADALEGRAAGTKGNDRAAAYLVKQFKDYGLERVVRGGRDWYQPFDAESPRYKTVATRNVIGWLQGSDETLAEEYVVIGAHFDHVGLGDFGSRERGRSNLKDRIHNGADDNASGTAGLLELAQAFAQHPPRRSLLFVAFSAEELGLLGSIHYCDHPEVPLDKAVAMVNFDMIGRSVDDYLFVGGVGTSPVWDALLAKHLESAGLAVERGAGGKAPTDSTSFYEKGIPVLFFHTNVHVDYHRVSDHPEFINYGAEQQILRAAFELIRDVADGDDRPPFATADGDAMPASMNKFMSMPSRARDLAGMVRARAAQKIDKKGCGRLGFAPAAALDGALSIGELLSEGPAAAAGLEIGDVVVQVHGEPVEVSRDVANALSKVKAGETVTVEIRRGGDLREVEVVVGK